MPKREETWEETLSVPTATRRIAISPPAIAESYPFLLFRICLCGCAFGPWSRFSPRHVELTGPAVKEIARFSYCWCCFYFMAPSRPLRLPDPKGLDKHIWTPSALTEISPWVDFSQSMPEATTASLVGSWRRRRGYTDWRPCFLPLTASIMTTICCPTSHWEHGSWTPVQGTLMPWSSRSPSCRLWLRRMGQMSNVSAGGHLSSPNLRG